jgi:ribosomal protein S18 acetylase RimI-like enzyme
MIAPAVVIRPATPDDHPAIWGLLEPVIRAGEELAVPRDGTRADAFAYWMPPGAEVFVAEDAGEIVGSYYLRANPRYPGGHVANAGYVTALHARGRGIARAMCRHSLDHARARGFRAMQYNFVVSTNERAVHLWQAMGFSIADRLPGAFAHPTLGFVDALVMYQTL